MSIKPFKNLFPLLFLSVFLVLFVNSCNEPDSKITARQGLATINGTELYFQRMGTGEPLVVVHGGPVLEHGYLVPYLKPLTDEYELIFFDQRLSGRSSADVDSSGVRLAEFVEDIEGIRTRFNLDKIHLLGHSWGGMLSMKYAITHPSNLRSLVLLNTMPASSELWKEEEQIITQKISREDRIMRQAIVTSDLYEKDRAEAVEKLLILFFRNQFQDPALADSLEFDIPDNYTTRGERFGNIMQDIRDYDLHPQLLTMKVPTLLVYGSIEPATTMSGPMLNKTIPNAEMVIIEDAGHFPFVEKPEIFLRELRAFLMPY